MAHRSVLKRMIESVASAGKTAASDRELLRRFADRGDQAAFSALVRRHTPALTDRTATLDVTYQPAEPAKPKGKDGK